MSFQNSFKILQCNRITLHAYHVIEFCLPLWDAWRSFSTGGGPDEPKVRANWNNYHLARYIWQTKSSFFRHTSFRASGIGSKVSRELFSSSLALSGKRGIIRGSMKTGSVSSASDGISASVTSWMNPPPHRPQVRSFKETILKPRSMEQLTCELGDNRSRITVQNRRYLPIH